jgi:D-xylose transport system permease protein
MSNLKEETPMPDAGQPGSADLSTTAPPVAGSAGEYLRASLVRIKGGETGVLPVVAGLLLVSVLFQIANNHFLTAGNLVNLLVQAAVFSLLAMGEVFALLLGEIDLSSGFVAGLAAVVMAELVQPTRGWPQGSRHGVYSVVAPSRLACMFVAGGVVFVPFVRYN